MLINTLIDNINSFNQSNSGKLSSCQSKQQDPIESLQRNYKGNQHDLDNYLNTMQYMQYQKQIRKNVRQTKIISKENTFSTLEDMHSHLEKDQFLKKWSRLDMYLKKLKIKEFVETKLESGSIKSDKKDYYIRKLNHLIVDKKLNKKNEITYDSEVGKIIDIPCFNKL